MEKISKKSVTPAISIVLVTKGTKISFLEKCLKSLINQTFNDFEIILIYKHFPKPLENLFKSYNIQTFQENTPTVGAARTFGVKKAKADIIAMIDDDAEAPKDWLEKIIVAFQNSPKLYCVGGPHITPKEEANKNVLHFLEGSFLEANQQKTYVDCSAIGKIATCNVAYRKKVFEKIGYLDETLRAGEDWEFNQRLVENDYGILFDSNIFVWHHRQGLKHAFHNSSNMVPFYLSLRTLKHARCESVFAMFYLSNVISAILLATLFFSITTFVLLFVGLLIGYSILTTIRTKTYSWRIIYFPFAILRTLAMLFGFYYGLLKHIISKIRKLVHMI